MNEEKIDLRTILSSKLAIRLIVIFVAVVAIPLAVTVLVVGRVGQQQIIQTTSSLEVDNESTVADAGLSFQRLGQAALRQSNLKIAKICLSANHSASEQSEKDQANAITASGRDFADVTQKCFDGAMLQSLSANREVLSEIGSQTGSLFASSSHYTEERVGDRVQTAMLEQINIQMRDRAHQLAQLCDSYVNTNMNYLELTAEMINLNDDDNSAQKTVLDALVRRFPMMTVSTVLDMTGRVTVFSASDRVEQPSDMVDQSTTAYFKTASNDESYIGIESMALGSAPVLRLAVPIELYRGNVDGVLSVCLSLDDLWDTVRNAHIGKSGHAYVTDATTHPFFLPQESSGAVLQQSWPINSLGWHLVVAEPQSEVMHPIQSFKDDISRNTQRSLSQMHADIVTASSLATSKLLKNAADLHAAATKQLESRTATIQVHLDQKTKLKNLIELTAMQKAIRSQILLAQTENDGQMVAAARTASVSLVRRIPMLTSRALYLAKRRLDFYATIILIASCGLSCLIGLLLAGALVRPILRLSRGTQSLADGDLSKRVDERAPAEIGDLAVAFNKMAESLQKSRADLTDAESQLVQSAKLASLGTLSAGVAHELNQPVAIVRGLAQQLKDDPSVPTEIQEDLQIIEGQTSRMMKIITHLRTFCRNGGYEQVPIGVNKVVRDCFILIDAQLKSHGVSVDMDLCDDDPHILGDANEMEQVFINLITNARDAMEGRPDARLSIQTRIEDQEVVLQFRDNGLGIPSDVADHIFDPFFTTKEVGKGTGLGLSISHGIVQKHRGKISVRNDNGAVFTITVPIVEAEPIDVEHDERTPKVRKAA
jgi:C4-dicarboxylate-specific signal transduction histidine kinase